MTAKPRGTDDVPRGRMVEEAPAFKRHFLEGSSMRRSTPLLIGFAFAGACCWLALPARTAADKEPPRKLAAPEIAQQWLPKGEGVGDWHNVGAGCPKDSPKLYVLSFRTSQLTFQEAWAFCMSRCGGDRKYAANVLEIGAGGSNAKGSWGLVERPGKGGEKIESLFCFRGEDHSVSVTLRPEDGGKGASGTLTVVVH